MKQYIIEFFKTLVNNVFLIGIVLFLFQEYFKSKFGPLTAEETLRKENALNGKRDAYFQSLELINKELSYSELIEKGQLVDTLKERRRGAEKPTELEVNSCFAKLCVYCNNINIPIIFRDIFINRDSNYRPIGQLINLVNLIKKDLSPDSGEIPKEIYKVIQITEK